MDAIALAIDPTQLGRELSVALPRYWKVLGELAMFLRSTKSDVYEIIINHLDLQKLVETVSAYGISHPYELRCLIWLLGHGSDKDRAQLAYALFDTVLAAAAACQIERPEILRAFSHMKHDLAIRMAQELKTELQQFRPRHDLPLSERSPEWRLAITQLQALDQAGKDYEIRPFAEIPVNQAWVEETEAWDEPLGD